MGNKRDDRLEITREELEKMEELKKEVDDALEEYAIVTMGRRDISRAAIREDVDPLYIRIVVLINLNLEKIPSKSVPGQTRKHGTWRLW